jgi:signal transduction histidine kinase
MGRRLQVRSVMKVLIGIVLLAGAVVTAALAGAFGMSLGESVELALTASVPVLVVGVAGWIGLRVSSPWPVAWQAVVVALSSAAAVVAGIGVAANRMFLSSHDLRVLAVIVAAAIPAGVAIALGLGARVAKASRALEDATRQIARGQPPEIELPPVEELARLGRELEGMSARLEEARERERALDTSRRELIAWVSHDLRTPLAGIRAMAEALEDGVIEDPATVARYHASMRSEVDGLAGLVDDLFELSRINAGQLRLQMEKASLGDLVSDALEAASAVAHAKGVRLEGRMTTEAPALALSTPDMARVLRNLLENAIRHTPGDGAVSVEAGVDHDQAFVSVADGCGGIPESDLARVFDTAFRGAIARTPNDGGGGLGLAIAKGLVEAHNGQIAVSNEVAGCRFTVTIPLPEGEIGA